eukprot:3019400-Pyramimonas_sp.AAC.1
MGDGFAVWRCFRVRARPRDAPFRRWRAVSMCRLLSLRCARRAASQLSLAAWLALRPGVAGRWVSSVNVRACGCPCVDTDAKRNTDEAARPNSLPPRNTWTRPVRRTQWATCPTGSAYA